MIKSLTPSELITIIFVSICFLELVNVSDSQAQIDIVPGYAVTTNGDTPNLAQVFKKVSALIQASPDLKEGIGSGRRWSWICNPDPLRSRNLIRNGFVIHITFIFKCTLYNETVMKTRFFLERWFYRFAPWDSSMRSAVTNFTFLRTQLWIGLMCSPGGNWPALLSTPSTIA